ncbi:hypothetical protein AYO44_02675 [Planctomycetaceae bacterium SCGC AG-212-F19]|nr:hypothetical protein AYO44_02675 [Planctomycetaceae bacterium SCGC AG-212-F19]
MSDDSEALAHFTGMVRLFPLPNVVLFPHVVQPLHIFEPRYREMTADALTDDRLIAPVLLRPGWEADYEGKPAIHPLLCVGRIAAEQRLPDGRYNLLLRGVSRGRIIAEAPSGKLYRTARVELLTEGECPEAKSAGRLRAQLAKVVQPWFPAQGPALGQLQKLVDNPELALGVLCDLLAFAVPLAVEVKQSLLEELDIGQRAEALVGHLRTGTPPTTISDPNRSFPPGFSPN